MEDGLVALREADNIDGLQITLPAAATKGTHTAILSLCLPSECNLAHDWPWKHLF